MVSPRPVKVLAIVGPTASGKTRLALDAAKRFDGQIINADSRQFYQGFDIGTAKPSPEELQTTVHHLIDCADPLEPWDVMRFVRAADEAIQKIQEAGKVPIVVGGTGLYFRALFYGLDDIPKISDDVRNQIRSRLESEGLASLFAELQAKDPIAADRLEPEDTQRILRALEVVTETGKGLSEYWSAAKNQRYDFWSVALTVEREKLYQRINERVEEMFQNGLKAEVRSLAENLGKIDLLEKTIGYREWLEFGFENEDHVKQEIQKNSRRFAKRQLTWFKKEADLHWYEPTDSEKILSAMETFLKS